MKGTTRIKALRLALLLVFALSTSFFTALYAQPWYRLGLDEGGVGEDVQLLRLSDNSLDSVVWSAQMEGGLFRSAWDGDEWGSWTEYLPGRSAFGVEAIKVGSTEYVLAATATMGIWYEDNPPTNDEWQRPHSDYPNNWDHIWTHDVAFYCDVNGNFGVTAPEDSFFVILVDTVELGQYDQNPGIYRWNGDIQNNYFKRVDADDNNDPSRGFAHFWRDLEDPNVLYSIMGKDPVDPPNYWGALYKFSGAYTQDSPSFDPVTIVPAGATLKEVHGFNQWDWEEENDVYSYALVFWQPSGQSDTYSIFVSHDLANATPNFDSLTTIGSNYLISIEDDWVPIERFRAGGKIIGKPYRTGGNIYHKLWITGSERYGLMYLDTRLGGNPTQINGNDLTGCKNWADRAFTPDPSHSGDSEMYLFMGTHKHGIWYLDFTSTSVYTWTFLEPGYMGIDGRGGFQLYCNASGTEILMPAWNTGLFRHNGSQWNELGVSMLTANSYHTDPSFRHGNQSACDFQYYGSPARYTYWGGGPSQIKADGTLYTQGGLYRLDNYIPSDNYGESEQEDFIDGSYSLAQEDSFTVLNLEVGRTADTSYLYLTTGAFGPDDDFAPGGANYICRKDSANEDWATIYTMTAGGNPDYEDLSVLSLAPYSLGPVNGIYIALGNVFGWTNTIPVEIFKARLEFIKNVSGNWSRDWEWTETTDYSSALDVATMPDPQYTGKDITFWAVYVLNIQNGYAGPGNVLKGMVYMRRWNPDSSLYSIRGLYPSGSNVQVGDKIFNPQPAGLEVACFELRGLPHLVASLTGYVVNDAAHAYVYTADIIDLTAQWHRLDNPVLGGIDLEMASQEIKVDPLHGYDFYVGADAGVMRYDNFYQPSPVQSANWNWNSFNKVDPQDSLKYLFAGADSLEIIRDQYGNRYKPYDNPPLDEIYVWNWLKCYAVKSWVADTLEVYGDEIPYDSAMVLYPAPQDSSWIYNYIAYLPTDTMTTNFAFAADVDTVLIVKNDNGQFWRPSDETEGFNMVPGEGYQVGVNDTMTHQYPANSGPDRITPPPFNGGQARGTASLEPTHFAFTEKTGDFYPIYIDNILINGQPPQTGDEVAVFAPNNNCVGAAVYEGSFPVKIAGWKNDPCTEAVDGYNPGDTLSFKMYDLSAGLEVPLEMMAIAQSYPPTNSYAFTRFEQGYYAEHHLQASSTLPGTYALLQNYPNPFNPTTTIRYDLPFESIVKLEIFDLMGRKVITLVDGKQTAGFRAVRWDGKNSFNRELASGVYFYRLTADATQAYMGKKEHYIKSHKMVLIK